jgi:hypothetical protein
MDPCAQRREQIHEARSTWLAVRHAGSGHRRDRRRRYTNVAFALQILASILLCVTACTATQPIGDPHSPTPTHVVAPTPTDGATPPACQQAC